MAEIALQGVRHAYAPRPSRPDDWALKGIDLVWQDGGAYALLGPSGCGKTTLLNIISGLVRPTEGRVRFAGRDVTRAPPDRRNIAQVFQFPVIYDTMSVGENLAFPLRNRGLGRWEAAQRVTEIAAMLELTQMLDRPAARLSADQKQKISLGRGLVREDVAAILFDEPLTVIDPHLKWRLRSKLRELHARTGRTMIYVTHDQTEALTFADQVVVMSEGEVVQIGTPEALFERPHHTFVGHFIGSPGMNLLPARVTGHRAFAEGVAAPIDIANRAALATPGPAEIGVRPEHVRLARPGEGGMAARLARVLDTGRSRLVELQLAGHPLRLLAPEGTEIPAEPEILFAPERTFLYRGGWLVEEAA